MCTSILDGNREIRLSPEKEDGEVGTYREVKRRTPMMNDNRKSDSCIVPEKSANKPVKETGAERMEGRRLVKRKTQEAGKSRTPSRKRPDSIRADTDGRWPTVTTRDRSRMR
jgi:hypothetical protein